MPESLPAASLNSLTLLHFNSKAYPYDSFETNLIRTIEKTLTQFIFHTQFAQKLTQKLINFIQIQFVKSKNNSFSSEKYRK